MKYETYIEKKLSQAAQTGFDCGKLPTELFPYQRDLVKWALRRARSAIFADTGLGKTFMQVAWADQVAKHTKGKVLIMAPLAVAEQTVREAAKLGVEIVYSRFEADHRITITNYEMISKFDPSKYQGVVLDESSILKAYDGATKQELIDLFKSTPFKLACTATPSPNDYTELGNHSEFLGIKSRQEMLAEYFVHDMDKTQDWRLKGHAVDIFWRWVASWGAVLRRPSDLGYSDDGFILPDLRMYEHIVDVSNEDAHKEGLLFAPEVISLSDQRSTRRATMEKRVALVAEIAKGKGPLLVWCELNDESDQVAAMIPGAVNVKGADDPDVKAKAMLDFAAGKIRVLVSKSSICGFGMNWQHCNRMVFMGASHSYEMTYQAIRRCWRFGQKRGVDVHIIRANTEQSIVRNYKRKEADAIKMGEEMASHVKDILTSEIKGTKREWNPYKPTITMTVPDWIGREETK